MKVLVFKTNVQDWVKREVFICPGGVDRCLLRNAADIS
ncbi:hypothetical protein SAMN05216352_1063 [Alteribacillus bidgolensis]|uniref:Uncharacterized protein n=1 Tax=Alteribacillus bidgolensis TaxID=930129 RepID=A0A1G8J1R2_9BACI|nr:hypothetical protein SAMN05216352_1063 [Alteribacillus bidgolensis]